MQGHSVKDSAFLSAFIRRADSGFWPVLPQMFHGATSLREVELLGESGLKPLATMQAATIDAARILRMLGLMGAAQSGKRADLIVLSDDFHLDVKAWRQAE